MAKKQRQVRKNGTAFKKAADRTLCRVRLRDHGIPRQFIVGFAEGGLAACAAPALNMALTKVLESLAGTVVTTFAGHIGLVFLAGQADNGVCVGIAAYPAC